jgi:hypothetical protein
LPYYMLFKHSPGSALDAPYGIHVEREGVNALCVFSSDEAAVKAREKAAKEYPPVREYYFEAVTPDDVVSLATIHGVDVVVLDAYVREPMKLMYTVDAVEALTSLKSSE